MYPDSIEALPTMQVTGCLCLGRDAVYDETGIERQPSVRSDISREMAGPLPEGPKPYEQRSFLTHYGTLPRLLHLSCTPYGLMARSVGPGHFISSLC